MLALAQGFQHTPGLSPSCARGKFLPRQQGKGSEQRRCLLPPPVPCRGGSPDLGESPLVAKCHSSVLAPLHTAALQGNPPLSHPHAAPARECHLELVTATTQGQPPTFGSVPSPAGLCKGSLGTAERLPRKTPCAGREQPVSSPGTGQSCSLLSLPRGEHAGSRSWTRSVPEIQTHPKSSAYPCPKHNLNT